MVPLRFPSLFHSFFFFNRKRKGYMKFKGSLIEWREIKSVTNLSEKNTIGDCMKAEGNSNGRHIDFLYSFQRSLKGMKAEL